MNCYICGQSTAQQPTVVIENKTRYIHKACFRCSICGSRLEGYLMKNDSLCCVDCLQTKMMNEKCAKCGDLIHGKKTKVKNRYYHPHCFTCDNCQKVIESNYFEKDDKHICLECYKQQKGSN